MISTDFIVAVDAGITSDELWEFYETNNCCETRYSQQRAMSVLRRSQIVVSARHNGRLIGITRAISDGIDAVLMEHSLALTYQGEKNLHGTGALIEDDVHGIGSRMVSTMVSALLEDGICFVQTVAFGDPDGNRSEIPFLEKCGFELHNGHVSMFVDKRPVWRNAG